MSGFRDQSWRWRKPKPPAFKLDAPLEHAPGCAFCAALNAQLDDGGGIVGRDSDAAQRLAIVCDLDALEREYGRCTCLSGMYGL